MVKPIPANFVNVPYGLPLRLVQDPVLLKDFWFYSQLKTYARSGVITGYPKKLDELCAHCKRYITSKDTCKAISPATFYAALTRIQKRGWVEKTVRTDGRMDLVFASWTRVLSVKKHWIHGNTIAKEHYYKVDIQHLPILDAIIQALAFIELLRQQYFKIQEKLVESALRTKGTYHSGNSNASRIAVRQAREAVNSNMLFLHKAGVQRFCSEAQTDPNEAFTKLKHPKSINPFVCMSRHRMTELLGFSSLKSIYNWLKVLKRFGLILEDSPRIFPIGQDPIYLQELNRWYTPSEVRDLFSNFYVFHGKEGSNVRLPNKLVMDLSKITGGTFKGTPPTCIPYHISVGGVRINAGISMM